MIKIRSQQLLKNINFKNLATAANSQAKNSSYKVVIVGGGSGGIAGLYSFI
jgi:chemotaxis response regulator CheB